MAGCTKFSMQYELDNRLDTVYESLLDFKKFGSLHPYMKEVDLVNKCDDFTEYKIREEVYFFGFIKNQPRYHAKVFELDKKRCIQYTSQVKSFIFLIITFHLVEKQGGKVHVKEDIEIQCNRLIGYIFSDILKRSHAAVFEKIKRLG